jgi:hypothetical protein
MAARASVLPKKSASNPAQEPANSLEDRIRSRAYELYLQRGGNGNSEIEDWLQAEAEIINAAKAK